MLNTLKVSNNPFSGATQEQRGLHVYSVTSDGSDNKYKDEHLSGYAYPEKVNNFLLRCRIINKLPFMPSESRLTSSISLDSVSNGKQQGV
jgi:hypothetical protein